MYPCSIYRAGGQNIIGIIATGQGTRNNCKKKINFRDKIRCT